MFIPQEQDLDFSVLKQDPKASATAAPGAPRSTQPPTDLGEATRRIFPGLPERPPEGRPLTDEERQAAIKSTIKGGAALGIGVGIPFLGLSAGLTLPQVAGLTTATDPIVQLLRGRSVQEIDPFEPFVAGGSTFLPTPFGKTAARVAEAGRPWLARGLRTTGAGLMGGGLGTTFAYSDLKHQFPDMPASERLGEAFRGGAGPGALWGAGLHNVMGERMLPGRRPLGEVTAEKVRKWRGVTPPTAALPAGQRETPPGVAPEQGPIQRRMDELNAAGRKIFSTEQQQQLTQYLHNLPSGTKIRVNPGTTNEMELVVVPVTSGKNQGKTIHLMNAADGSRYSTVMTNSNLNHAAAAELFEGAQTGRWYVEHMADTQRTAPPTREAFSQQLGRKGSIPAGYPSADPTDVDIPTGVAQTVGGVSTTGRPWPVTLPPAPPEMPQKAPVAGAKPPAAGTLEGIAAQSKTTLPKKAPATTGRRPRTVEAVATVNAATEKDINKAYRELVNNIRTAKQKGGDPLGVLKAYSNYKQGTPEYAAAARYAEELGKRMAAKAGETPAKPLKLADQVTANKAATRKAGTLQVDRTAPPVEAPSLVEPPPAAAVPPPAVAPAPAPAAAPKPQRGKKVPPPPPNPEESLFSDEAQVATAPVKAAPAPRRNKVAKNAEADIMQEQPATVAVAPVATKVEPQGPKVGQSYREYLGSVSDPDVKKIISTYEEIGRTDDPKYVIAKEVLAARAKPEAQPAPRSTDKLNRFKEAVAKAKSEKGEVSLGTWSGPGVLRRVWNRLTAPPDRGAGGGKPALTAEELKAGVKPGKFQVKDRPTDRIPDDLINVYVRALHGDTPTVQQGSKTRREERFTQKEFLDFLRENHSDAEIKNSIQPIKLAFWRKYGRSINDWWAHAFKGVPKTAEEREQYRLEQEQRREMERRVAPSLSDEEAPAPGIANTERDAFDEMMADPTAAVKRAPKPEQTSLKDMTADVSPDEYEVQELVAKGMTKVQARTAAIAAAKRRLVNADVEWTDFRQRDGVFKKGPDGKSPYDYWLETVAAEQARRKEAGLPALRMVKGRLKTGGVRVGLIDEGDNPFAGMPKGTPEEQFDWATENLTKEQMEEFAAVLRTGNLQARARLMNERAQPVKPKLTEDAARRRGTLNWDELFTRDRSAKEIAEEMRASTEHHRRMAERTPEELRFQKQMPSMEDGAKPIVRGLPPPPKAANTPEYTPADLRVLARRRAAKGAGLTLEEMQRSPYSRTSPRPAGPRVGGGQGKPPALGLSQPGVAPGKPEPLEPFYPRVEARKYKRVPDPRTANILDENGNVIGTKVMEKDSKGRLLTKIISQPLVHKETGKVKTIPVRGKGGQPIRTLVLPEGKSVTPSLSPERGKPVKPAPFTKRMQQRAKKYQAGVGTPPTEGPKPRSGKVPTMAGAGLPRPRLIPRVEEASPKGMRVSFSEGDRILRSSLPPRPPIPRVQEKSVLQRYTFKELTDMWRGAKNDPQLRKIIETELNLRNADIRGTRHAETASEGSVLRRKTGMTGGTKGVKSSALGGATKGAIVEDRSEAVKGGARVARPTGKEEGIMLGDLAVSHEQSYFTAASPERDAFKALSRDEQMSVRMKVRAFMNKSPETLRSIADSGDRTMFERLAAKALLARRARLTPPPGGEGSGTRPLARFGLRLGEVAQRLKSEKGELNLTDAKKAYDRVREQRTLHHVLINMRTVPKRVRAMRSWVYRNQLVREWQLDAAKRGLTPKTAAEDPDYTFRREAGGGAGPAEAAMEEFRQTVGRRMDKMSREELKNFMDDWTAAADFYQYARAGNVVEDHLAQAKVMLSAIKEATKGAPPPWTSEGTWRREMAMRLREARAEVKKQKEARQKVFGAESQPVTPEEAKALFDEKLASMPPARRAAVQEALDHMDKSMKDLLDAQVDSGLVSKEMKSSWAKRGDYIAPMNRLLVSIGEARLHAFGKSAAASMGATHGSSVSVAQATKAFEGLKQLPTEDGPSAWIRRLYSGYREVAHNNSAKTMVDFFSKSHPEDVYRAIPGADVPYNYTELPVWRNGVKETWHVPAEFATPYLELSSDEIAAVLGTPRWLRWFRDSFTQAATTYAAGFFVANPWRDVSEARFGAKTRAGKPIYSAFDPVDWAKSHTVEWGKNFYEALTKSPAYREMVRAKAGQTGLTSTTSPSVHWAPYFKINAAGERIVTMRHRGIFKGYTLAEVASAGEHATKLMTWKRAKAMGLSNEEAADIVREWGGSPDFAQGGTYRGWMSVLGMFVNPNIQERTRITRLAMDAKRGNAGAKKMLGRAAMGSLGAALALDKWNSQFVDEEGLPEIRHVDKRIRDNNTVIFLPWKVQMADGTVRWAFTKAPRTTPAVVAHALIDPALELFKRGEAVNGTDFANRLTNVLLPGSGKWDWKQPVKSGMRTALSMANPALGAPIELWGGEDTFTGRKLTPVRLDKRSPEMQISSNTNPAVVAFAKNVNEWAPVFNTLGLSPITFEYLLRKMAPGPTQAALSTLSSIGEVGGVLHSSDTTKWGRLKNAPLGIGQAIGRFGGPSGIDQVVYESKQRLYDAQRALQTASADEKAEERHWRSNYLKSPEGQKWVNSPGLRKKVGQIVRKQALIDRAKEDLVLAALQVKPTKATQEAYMQQAKLLAKAERELLKASDMILGHTPSSLPAPPSSRLFDMRAGK